MISCDIKIISYSFSKNIIVREKPGRETSLLYSKMYIICKNYIFLIYVDFVTALKTLFNVILFLFNLHLGPL